MKKHLRNNQINVMILLLTVLVMTLTTAISASVDDNRNTEPVGQTTPGVTVAQPTPGYIANQVVIKFDGLSYAKKELKKLNNAEVIGELDFAPVYLLQYDSIDVYQEADRLAAKTGVTYAHPNFVTDSTHGVQGSRPIGDEPGSGGHKDQEAAEMLDLDRVHPAATGNGVRVGLIDGGINFDHPLFDTMAVHGWDFVDQDGYAYDEPGGEISGHGTFVAGMLRLVAPSAELFPYRVIDTCGHGDGFTMARAIERAVTDDCKLINLSVILTGRHWAVKDAIEYAEEQDRMVVVAAGNYASGEDSYPAAEHGALAVAAIDSLYVLADFSSFGQNIDVCAPGVDLYSSYLDSIYAWWSGTSFATPCVTGQLALMAEIYPLISVDDYYTIIADNSIDLDQYNPGFEDSLGHGMINTYRAVVAAGVMAIEDPAMPDDPTVIIDCEPMTIYAMGVPHQSFPVTKYFTVNSSNAPAVYKAEVVGVKNTFTTVGLATGLTEGQVRVNISAEEIYKTGTYTDRIAVQVLGADQAVFVEVVLNVVDSVTAGTPEAPEGCEFAVTNYPNPFNPSTTIQFGLPEASHVRLKVYNILGQEVACLIDRWMAAGQHQVDWHGTDDRGEQLGSGVYFYRIEAGRDILTHKMTLIK